MSADLPLIIVNPVSGKGTSEQKWASMAGIIHSEMGPFDCVFTQKRGDAIQIAADAARSGRKLIISVGGDGTVSEVANGILLSKTGAEMGMLPGGTGGDYRKILNLSPQLATAAREIKNGKSRIVDIGRLKYIDHEGNPEERYFVNTASFGMSGLVASRANKSSKLLGGTFTYVAATLRTIVTYDRPEIFVELNSDSVRRLRIVTGCVSIGPTFGGGMIIAPDAKMDDGLFDLTLIGNIKTPKILFNSYRLYSGSILNLAKVGTVRSTRVTISPVRADEEILLEVDGESPGKLPATMEIVPQALRVRVP